MATPDPARDAAELAARIRAALTQLGHAWQAKDGTAVEIAFASIAVAPTQAFGPIALLAVDLTRLPRRVSVDDLTCAKTLHHLAAVCGRPVRVLSPGAMHGSRVDWGGLTYAITLEPQARRSLPRAVDLDGAGDPPPGAYMVPVGMGEAGPLWRSLPDLDCVLLAGQRGMGKSSWANVALAWLLSHNSPERLKVALIDPKEVEFSLWYSTPHLLGAVARNSAEAASLLAQVFGELDGRRALFARYGVRSLAAFNARAAAPLPPVLVVVDEVADLGLEEGQKGPALTTLTRLVSKGRAFGIHAMLATQRPDAEAVRGILKANIASRFAFWLPDGDNYRIALNPPKGFKLPALPRIPGRCIARLADGFQVLQGFHLPDRELERMAAEVAAGRSSAVDAGPLGPEEIELVRWALAENDGALGIENIERGLGLSSWKARRLAETWQARGWLEKPGPATARRRLSGTLVELVERLEAGEVFDAVSVASDSMFVASDIG